MDQDSNVKISKNAPKNNTTVVKIVFERFTNSGKKNLKIQAISLYYFLDFSF
ncbi:MAG: hypothetical protein CM1200mP1_00470 [Candidatus Neomarinimicrobiota bacterium]|nr:MAG: hypothetical protein CM1200mP1_00470 [Candidatus Neomarinimicrobiota bacterium]